MNRYLFLDVDGVLNCNRDYQVYVPSGLVINQEKCRNLVNALKDIDVKWILSSTWRLNQSSIEYLNQFIPIHDITPKLNNRARGYEIDTYMEKNPCDRYVIVDDDSDMLMHQLPWFVQTTVEHGLTGSHIHRIQYLLEHGYKAR